MEDNISYSTQLKWFLKFPVDKDGKPTSEDTYHIIKYLFENRNKSHDPERVANSLLLHPEFTRCVCRQLEFIDLVFQDPRGSSHYRYQLNSQYSELQAKVEISLLENHM